MKKLMMGFMMGAMCLMVSAQQPTTSKQDNTETKSQRTISKRQKPSSLSTPGYTGTPRPNAPRRHSNPMPKLEKHPEGTTPTLSPR